MTHWLDPGFMTGTWHQYITAGQHWYGADPLKTVRSHLAQAKVLHRCSPATGSPLRLFNTTVLARPGQPARSAALLHNFGIAERTGAVVANPVACSSERGRMVLSQMLLFLFMGVGLGTGFLCLSCYVVSRLLQVLCRLAGAVELFLSVGMGVNEVCSVRIIGARGAHV